MVFLVLMAASLGSGDPPGLDISVPTDRTFSLTWNKLDFSHTLWNNVLRNHVNELGLVDYDAVRSDRRFREYVYRIANTDPAGLADDDARLAFWINAYNALVIQSILETMSADRNQVAPHTVITLKVPGIKEAGKGFFAGLRSLVGQKRYTLDEIEKVVLLHQGERYQADRARIDSVGLRTPDPRIHFALVCGAKGCPRLRRVAYQGSIIDSQLDDAVKQFVKTRVSFDTAARIVSVSELLNWYADDLTNRRYRPYASSVIAFLARYVDNEPLRKSLGTDLWVMRFTKYDWTLNRQ